MLLRFALLAALLAPSALAQSNVQSNAQSNAQSSSSLQSHLDVDSVVQDQYPNQGGYQGGYDRQRNNYGHSSTWSDHVAIEAGGGVNVPAGNTNTWQDVGYSINVGGGWMFTKRLGVLAEYGFNRANIPSDTLTNVGEPEGNVHVWSLTLDPVFYYKTSGHFGGYVTGGGGFYRKLTSFTEPVYVGDYCDYFYGCYPQYANVTLSHFSSNQGGANLGTGVTFKPNLDGKMKIFAEARYVWVDSPTSSATAVGTGTVGMFPVTFGVRF